ncbi:MAG: hypothetical protein K8I04_10275 [Gammaproteobacteria bacterium]|nr:hypothetical protein [Gammaproteobacteria bacterium]
MITLPAEYCNKINDKKSITPASATNKEHLHGHVRQRTDGHPVGGYDLAIH